MQNAEYRQFFKRAQSEKCQIPVAPSGSKTWRMSYRQPNGKNTRLSFGAYPEVSLMDARKKRMEAKKMRAAGSDPAQSKRDKKQAVDAAERHTFEMVAREWLQKTAATRAESTNGKVTAWLEKDVFPSIGGKPVSAIKPLDVLATVQKMEARGAIDSSHRVKQICGQVLRFAVASGLVERDVAVDLKGALSKVPRENYIPKQFLANPNNGKHGKTYSSHFKTRPVFRQNII